MPQYLTDLPRAEIVMTANTPIWVDDLCSKSVYVYGYAPGAGQADVQVNPTGAPGDWFTVVTLDPASTDHLVAFDTYGAVEVQLATSGGATFDHALLLLER